MGMIYAPLGIIPNGALINNVCHIYQSTKPTTRPDGSALVIGDKWYNISTGVEGFWNGTYFVSSQLFNNTVFFPSALTITTVGVSAGVLGTTSILIERTQAFFFIQSGNLSAVNYHVLRLFNFSSSLNDLNITEGNNAATNNFILRTSNLINIAVIAPHILTFSFRYDAMNGTPPSTSSPPSASISYRNIL